MNKFKPKFFRLYFEQKNNKFTEEQEIRLQKFNHYYLANEAFHLVDDTRNINHIVRVTSIKKGTRMHSRQVVFEVMFETVNVGNDRRVL